MAALFLTACTSKRTKERKKERANARPGNAQIVLRVLSSLRCSAKAQINFEPKQENSP
jgi:hypothetical protein